MELKEKIEQSGLTASDIHTLLDKKVSISQAARWLKHGGPVAVQLLLWRLCDERTALPARRRGRPANTANGHPSPHSPALVKTHPSKHKPQGQGQPARKVEPMKQATPTEPVPRPAAPPIAAIPNARPQAATNTQPVTEPTQPTTSPTSHLIAAKEVPYRGRGNNTTSDAGDFHYFEHDGRGWKVPVTYPKKALYDFGGAIVDTSRFSQA